MFEPKLGVTLATLSMELTPELFDLLAASSIATVEVSASLLQGDAAVGSVAALREGLARSGVIPASIHSLFGEVYDFSVGDEAAHQAAVQHGLIAIDHAAALGAPLVIVHASAEPVEPNERAARLAQAGRGLEALGQRAAATGTQLAVEVLPRTCLGNTIDELLDLLDELDPTAFGICLDTNHLMDRYDTLAEEIRRLGDRLIATHLSDYDGVDEKHELPGRGVVDWAAVVDALREIDYRGPFNYESKPAGETPRERIASLEENFAWLSGLGARNDHGRVTAGAAAKPTAARSSG